MGSFDSSPNYKRATSRFEGKKENSPQGGSECDDMISVTCESSINGSPYAQKLKNGIKQRSSNKKTLKNFGKVRSFRTRLKPRIVTSPVPISDEDSLLESSHSSPHYLQPTTSSEGKKTLSQTSSHHSESPLSDRSFSQLKSFQTLSRTSSFRNVRILKKKASFRPKRSSLNYPKVVVDRATYSSTVKDSKFPEPVELESEISSGVKVCRYHHCSLHGCRGGHNPDPPPKRLLYKKRRSLKKQKSIMPRTESRHGEKSSKSQTVPIVEPLNQERIINKNVVNSQEEIFYNQEAQPFGDGYKDIEEAILIEVAFGETSFPDRSYRENLDILRKYSSLDQDFGGQSSCSCHNTQKVVSTPSRAETEVPLHNVTSFSPDEIPLTGSTDVSLSLFKNPNEASGLIWPETLVLSDEVAEKKSAFSSASYSQTSSDGNSEEEIESRNESTTSGDSKVDEVLKVEDSEVNSPVLTGSTLHFSKPRHISMWHMIHQHLSSNLSVEHTNQPVQGADGPNSTLATTSSKDSPDSDMNGVDNDSETREIEIRKLFAIKLVREAIEKILLPEVQDQTSDDQSVVSESTPRPEIIENNQSKEVDIEGGEANLSSNPKEESVTADDASSGKIRETEEKLVTKSEKKAPKHWSNLKKWILLQRFIRELEKVRKFNPRKPSHLPLNPDPETEKVNLRPQTLDDRKNAEEWMLDYALRQAVSQLAPTQKRKVSLLVKAFETVVPQQDDSQVQIRTPRPKINSLDVPILGSKGQETGIKMTNETSKVCHQDKQAHCIEGRMNDSSQTEQKNHIKMWHMIYHHVVSGIAEKVGKQLLDGSEDDEVEENGDSDDFSNNLRGGLTKSNALKLVKEAVDEILVPEIQDDSSDTQSVTSEGANLTSKEEDTKGESQVIKNWSKLKKLLLLKRSIRALEKARISKPQSNQLVHQVPDPEPEKVDLRRKMMDERKKAEQWMLDYAVQHIVTKLTPARKRRVSMLVEAFEAVVPIPER